MPSMGDRGVDTETRQRLRLYKVAAIYINAT
jgi:hypothetical protein